MSAWLDVLYPPKCALCGAIGTPPICVDCRKEFKPYFERSALRRGGIDSYAGCHGYEGRASQAVRRLKFDRVTSLAGPMSEDVAKSFSALPPYDVVIPVPIHVSRLRQRGFNQSDLLVESLPRALVRRDVLVRTRATEPQVGLTREERLRNLEGAFQAVRSLERKRVLLVDDVLTTGGTAVACATALREQGAVLVGVLAYCN